MSTTPSRSGAARSVMRRALARLGSVGPTAGDAMLYGLGAAFAGTQFAIFAGALARGDRIEGIVLPAQYQLTRSQLDQMSEEIRARDGYYWAGIKTAPQGSRTCNRS